MITLLVLLAPTALLAQPAPAPTTPPPGVWVAGRADAPVRVVEYLSFTCSHCAEQEAATGPQLEALVKRGAVALETRHALRDPIDFGVAVAARCQGPAAYEGNKLALFAAQGTWLPKAADYLQANQTRLAAMEPAAAHLDLLAGSGVLDLMRTRGLTRAKALACLSDPAEAGALAAQTTEAWQGRGISGTPTTFVNGQMVDGHDWPTLHAAIQAASGRPTETTR